VCIIGSGQGECLFVWIGYDIHENHLEGFRRIIDGSTKVAWSGATDGEACTPAVRIGPGFDVAVLPDMV
jgi:hypothetical protein